MNHREVVAYLSTYEELKYNLEFYENKMTGLKSIRYSNEEKGATLTEVNPLTLNMARVDDITREMKAIENLIENNLTGKYRLIIWYKFINGRTLETISEDIGYSLPQTKRLYHEAISDLGPFV